MKNCNFLQKSYSFRWHVTIVFVLLFFSHLSFSQGQQVPMVTDYGTKYLEYLPTDYTNGQDYPLLIFLHGLGEKGDDVNKLLVNGIPKLINEGSWPSDRPFIVISPQLKYNQGDWWNSHTTRIVNYVIENYNVDEDRIYMTGLSLGGQGTYIYALKNPEMLAAAVPVAGWADANTACNMKDVPTWGFVGENDHQDNNKYRNGTINMINGINACVPAPPVPAQLTFIAGGGHNSATWNGVYDTAKGHDIYSWMLQFSKNDSTTVNQPPVSNAGSDKSITLPANSITLTGSGTDSDGIITSYQWSQITGPSTATLSGQTTAVLSASNLIEGIYTFSLSVTDNAGASNSDEAIVTISSESQVSVAWESYNIMMQAGSIQGTIVGNESGPTANMEFYESTNNFGVNKGNLFSTFNGVNHPQYNSAVENYWANGSGNKYPYAGKSTIGRGSETGEGNSQAPLGVFDLQLHPPNTDKLVVAAFVVPIDGQYSLSDLGARRVSHLSGTTRFKVFNQNKVEILNLQATNDQDWVISGTPIVLGELTAGDRIYFAVDREGTYASDFTEVTWTVNLSPEYTSPIADAGDDVSISLPQNQVTLTGTGTATSGTTVAYAWTQEAGPSVATLSGGNTSNLTASDLIVGSYTFRLTVTDENSSVGFDEVIVTVEEPAAEQLSWSSYNVLMQASSSQQGVVMSDNNSVQATIEFYESTNNFGVNKGSLFSTFNPVNHPQQGGNVENYWANGTGFAFPYAGKSKTGRGNEQGEGNVPAPLGVFDLQVHPPNNDKLVVAAFVVPVDGQYSLSDFGARRVSNLNQTVKLFVFDQNKVEILNLQATNNQDWVITVTDISLGALTAGDRIYFAVGRDGNFYSDFAEITWTVNLSSNAGTTVENGVFAKPSAALAESKKIQDEALMNAVKFYPNPVNDKLFLNKEFSNSTVSIYSIAGKEISNQKINEIGDGEFHLNLIGLKSGIYILKMIKAGKTEQVKFIKL